MDCPTLTLAMEEIDYLDYFNADQRAPTGSDRRGVIDRSNPLNDFDCIHFRDRFRIYSTKKTQLTLFVYLSQGFQLTLFREDQTILPYKY